MPLWSARSAQSLLAALAAALLCTRLACAAEVRVLSAGAVEPGLRSVLAAFEQASGDHVSVSFATPTAIRERVQSGAGFDLVITPPEVMDALAASGQIGTDPAGRVTIGRVGIGVAVRPGAKLPDISTPEAFVRTLVDADSIVYNRASTGTYLETLLLKRLNLDLLAKTTHYADGAMVMDHVMHGTGREIGMGAITEIRLVPALQYVGPLPAALQNTTTYRAATAAAPADEAAALALLRQLGSPAAQAMFRAAGIDPAD